MAEAREAEHLAAAFEHTGELVSFLAGQLAVLRTQAQAFVGIAGICISVTGFAGHNMVNAGPLSAGAMILGISLILVAIVITLRCLANIRWVTQDLGDSNVELARRVLSRRNQLQHSLQLAVTLIGVGLGFYVIAVVLAALSRAHWSPP